MEFSITSQALMGAGLIFLLRIADMSLDTLRMLMVIRGRKGIAWVLGFFQSAIFVGAITSVLSNLDNPLNIVGYAAGFATGNVLGILIEDRLAIGHSHMRIISSLKGAALAERIRKEGFAVTEIPARGRDGMVTLINCSLNRRHLSKVYEIVEEVDPDAFITAEEVRPVRRGYWRA